MTQSLSWEETRNQTTQEGVYEVIFQSIVNSIAEIALCVPLPVLSRCTGNQSQPHRLFFLLQHEENKNTLCPVPFDLALLQRQQRKRTEAITPVLCSNGNIHSLTGANCIQTHTCSTKQIVLETMV